MSLQTIQLDSVLSQSAASDNGTGTWEILKEREKKKLYLQRLLMKRFSDKPAKCNTSDTNTKQGIHGVCTKGLLRESFCTTVECKNSYNQCVQIKV